MTDIFNRHIVKIIFLSLLSITLLAGAGEATQKKAKRRPAAIPSKPAVNADYGKYAFTLKTLDGKTISLADYAGKVVLVNIWAPWCGPCKLETPGFVELYKQYKPKGLEILGVAIQTTEDDVRSFIQRYQVSWPIGINEDIATSYGTYGIPDSYIFRADGSLAKRFVGYAREDAVRPVVEEALKLITAK